MAIKCLVVLGKEERQRNTKLTDILCDFYIYNLMTGCVTKDKYILLHEDIANILDSVKLQLRKCCSNLPLIV